MLTQLRLVSLSLSLVFLPSGSGQTFSLVDILNGAGSSSPNNQQSPSPQPQQQQQRQTGRQIDGMTVDLGALPNTVDHRSASTGTSGASGPRIHNVFGRRGSSSGSVSQSRRTQGSCTPQEKRTLFNSCAMSFGMAHMQYFDSMARQRTCRADVFDCGQVDSLIRCVNSQPVSVISNRCWPAVADSLTEFFHQYRLRCSYQDIKQHCQSTSADLLPIDQRQRTGQGINSNPMALFMPMIRRIMMPMVMMGMMRAQAMM